MLETLKKKEDTSQQKQRAKKPKKATVSSQFKVKWFQTKIEILH